MRMHIEVQRAAEALEQSHRPAQRLASREFGLADQNPLMARNTIDSAAPLAAGLLQLNPPLAPIDLTT
jgi:hypothetical protein